MGAGDGGRSRRRTWVRRLYLLASIGLIVAHSLLRPAGPGVVFLAVAGAVACVAVGRRAVEPGLRAPWTLLLWALSAFVVSNVALLAHNERIVTIGWLIDAAANALALAAALALIIRRGALDLGGLADAAVIALATGSLLWGVLPRRIGGDASFAAQIDLFVAVFALTGVLGAFLRLARTTTGQRTALWWLLTSIGLGIGGNIVNSVGGAAQAPTDAADAMFIAAFTAVGMFGLDPAGSSLAQPHGVSVVERLTTARLAFLAVAVSAVPAVAGARGLIAGNRAGLLVIVQGVLVSTVVMARIGILGNERARAERALAHEATHDPLTQLPNRREFLERLRAATSRGRRCTVLFCDLDGFKAINDEYGHDAGDSLLVDVAAALQACVPDGHVVSRFGGDEFVILLLDTTQHEAETVAQCAISAVSRPLPSIGGARVAISIGKADTDQERDPERLINAADHAMYKVKTTHKGPANGET